MRRAHWFGIVFSYNQRRTVAMEQYWKSHKSILIRLILQQMYAGLYIGIVQYHTIHVLIPVDIFSKCKKCITPQCYCWQKHTRRCENVRWNHPLSAAYREGPGWKKTALAHICLTGMRDVCRCVFCGPPSDWHGVYFTLKCGNLALTQVHRQCALTTQCFTKRQEKNNIQKLHSLTSWPSLKCYIAFDKHRTKRPGTKSVVWCCLLRSIAKICIRTVMSI